MNSPHEQSTAAPESHGGPAGASPSTGLRERVSRLYAVAENSDRVFGSPLGPFTLRGRSYHLPRFLYFGSPGSDAAVRLAFLAGFDGREERPSRALLAWLEQLATAPDLGEGLNLTFFPLVNPSGFFDQRRTNSLGHDLATQHWNLSPAPEISLLAQDARHRAYHGFVILTADDVLQVTGRVRFGIGSSATSPASVVEPQPRDEFPVQWLSSTAPTPAPAGPLSLSEDLPFAPFEVTLSAPRHWFSESFTQAAVATLRQFLTRYRAHLAYGIHL